MHIAHIYSSKSNIIIMFINSLSTCILFKNYFNLLSVFSAKENDNNNLNNESHSSIQIKANLAKAGCFQGSEICSFHFIHNSYGFQ